MISNSKSILSITPIEHIKKVKYHLTKAGKLKILPNPSSKKVEKEALLSPTT